MRRHVLLASLTTAFAAMAALPIPAHASDNPAIVEAKARFEEGVEFADAGKHEPARIKFEQAYSVYKSATILYNLARSEQLTGHELEAFEHFRTFLRTSVGDPRITEAMRERAKQNVADLTHSICQIEIGVPATARVILDGRPLEPTHGEAVAVKPGLRSVNASFSGSSKEMTVDCPVGATVKATFDFERDSSAPPPTSEGSEWSTGRVITVGALGAGAIAGGVLGFIFLDKAASNADEAEMLRASKPCANPASDSCKSAGSTSNALSSDHDTNTAIGAASIVAGGVFVVGVAATILFWPKDKKGTARISPVVGPGYHGANFAFTF